MDTARYDVDMNQTSTSDKRQRPPFPVPAQPGDETDLVGRVEAAKIMGVTVRTVTRYASDELRYITKYEDARGRVRFSRRQCAAMVAFEPAPG